VIYDHRRGINVPSELRRVSITGVDSSLISGPASNSVVAWTPDRKWLLFLSDRRGAQGIWAVQVSERGVEGEPREVIPDAPKWETFGVSNTGTLLYRHFSDTVDVYTAELDLSAGRTLAPPRRVMDRDIGSVIYPSWSEDGTRLVFA